MAHLTFPIGADFLCLDVNITDDTALELEETFTVTLTTLDPDVMLDNSLILITVIDNDGKIETISIVVLYHSFRGNHWPAGH